VPAPYDQAQPMLGFGDVTKDVIEDLSKRSAHGVKIYKTVLQYGNRRDPLKDAYQEAMDLTVYLRQGKEEYRIVHDRLRRAEDLLRRWRDSLTESQEDARTPTGQLAAETDFLLDDLTSSPTHVPYPQEDLA